MNLGDMYLSIPYIARVMTSDLEEYKEVKDEGGGKSQQFKWLQEANSVGGSVCCVRYNT